MMQVFETIPGKRTAAMMHLMVSDAERGFFLFTNVFFGS